MRAIAAAFAFLLCLAGAAEAQSTTSTQATLNPGTIKPGTIKPGTIERVRERGVLRCGSAIRPGLAFPAVDHSWHGLNVEMCHAIAAAILGDNPRVEFNGYALKQDFARLANGEDDVGFLTGTELFTNELLGTMLAGPAVFQLGTQIMVWDTSPIHHVAELGRTMVCDEPGTGAERILQAYRDAHHWDANISGWMELEEMMDAFNVGRCPAVIGESTALSALRLGSEQQGHPSRLLPEPLAITPVMAVSAVNDPRWSQVVSWAVNTILTNQPGQDTLSIPGAVFGLDKDWQARVRAVGTYDAMYQRSLGTDSPLDLPRGLNGPWQQGGILPSPTID